MIFFFALGLKKTDVKNVSDHKTIDSISRAKETGILLLENQVAL